ncbi:MAG: tail fiber domain-containing protein [Mucilaginibacter sp.]
MLTLKASLSTTGIKLFIILALIAAQSITVFAQEKPAKKTAKKAVGGVLRTTNSNDAPALYISPTGNVGIGTNDPHHKLQMNGNLHMDGNYLFFPSRWTDSSAFIKWRYPDTFTGGVDDEYRLSLVSYDGVGLGDIRSHANYFPILRAGFKNQAAAVDIMGETRSGSHPTGGLAMYVTGAMDSRGRGVEFRSNDGSGGIGFTKDTIYQTAESRNINFLLRKLGKFTFTAGGEERMFINSAGHVGIAKTLGIGGDVTVGGMIYLGSPYSSYRNIAAINNGSGIYMEFKNAKDGNGANRGFRFTEDAGGTAIMRMRGTFVGIGIDDPEFPLDIRGERGSGVGYAGSEFTRYGSNGISSGRGFGTCSVYASGDFVTRNAFVGSYNESFSDARLKKDIHASSPGEDLSTIRRVQVVNYKMIDTITDSRTYKKVIAQQVQQVYPNAVNTSFRALPNVFQKALSVTSQQDSLYLITMAKPHHLKPGDKVELKLSPAADVTVPVTQVNRDGSFTVASTVALDKQKSVFVYGTFATDVLTVDYDAISMLNVSATQQLAQTVDEQKKLIQQLTLENEKLRKEQAESKTTVNAILVRLTQMEESKSKPQGAVTAQALRNK